MISSPHIRAILLVCAVLLNFTNICLAQEASLHAAESGPYYAGVPIELQIKATGFAESPQPTVDFAPLVKGSLTLAGVSPNVSRSIKIINGKMTQTNSVQFIFHYRFLVDKPGSYKIGPFRVIQKTAQKAHAVSIAAARLKVDKIKSATNQRVKMILPKGDIYVGQRIPIELQWWVEADKLENLLNQQAMVPFFERKDEFQFYEIDEQADNRFAIVNASGAQAVAASTDTRVWNNKQYAVWSVKRLMVPLKAGTFTVEPAMVTVEEGIRWRRDFFGQRTVSKARKLRSVDQVRELTVKTLPIPGRPASFAGAVGQGFMLEVAADRSVVQVGDPINITLTLSGDADVASASLPPLSVSLPAKQFRSPSAKMAGQIEEGKKIFNANIRVLDANVSEIPPIAYSWFNPQTKQYETSFSRPIALSVKASKIVSANDVIRAIVPDSDEQKDEFSSQSNNADQQVGQSGAATRSSSQFTLSGADLSIEKDLLRLTSTSRSWLGEVWLSVLCYSLSVLIIVLAFVLRNRAEKDPLITVREKNLKTCTDKLSVAQNIADISDALRRMAAVAEQVPRVELDALLAECDNRVFAPGGESATVDAGLRNRALALAEQLAK